MNFELIIVVVLAAICVAVTLLCLKWLSSLRSSRTSRKAERVLPARHPRWYWGESVEKPFEISLLHPKRLAKGKTSNIKIKIYLDKYREMVEESITPLLDNFEEKRNTSLLKPGMTITIHLSSSAFVFDRNDVKRTLSSKGVNSIEFNVAPTESCSPGYQNVILCLIDPKTEVELDSYSFSLYVDDYAFDHISKPKASYLYSLATGIGSAAIFILTFFQQLDTTLGAAAGTAAAAAATFYGIQPTRVYNHQSPRKLSKTHFQSYPMS